MNKIIEANIVIGGRTLSIGESMTLRVALTVFEVDLGAGHRTTEEGYKRCRESILKSILEDIENQRRTGK